MSTVELQALRCPACAHDWQHPLYRGLHITRLPAVRKAILDGTWQLLTCPACGIRVQATRLPLIYTDFAHPTYIAVEGRGHADWRARVQEHQQTFDTCFTFGPPDAEALGSHLQPRLVFGLGALREKLQILDAGLDDRVVEALKADLLAEAGLRCADAQLRIAAFLPGGHLMFVRLPPSGAERPLADGIDVVPPLAPLDYVTTPQRRYARRAEQRARIADDHPHLRADWVVDAHVTA